jgi:hypothetical protein
MTDSNPMARWQMIKNHFFLLLINILIVRNALEKAVFTKAGMATLRRNCGFEVPILNDPTS